MILYYIVITVTHQLNNDDQANHVLFGVMSDPTLHAEVYLWQDTEMSSNCVLIRLHPHHPTPVVVLLQSLFHWVFVYWFVFCLSELSLNSRKAEFLAVGKACQTMF